jgi:hypothetical protein
VEIAMSRIPLALLTTLWPAACAPVEDTGDSDSGEEHGIDCGEPESFDVGVAARVEDAEGQGIEGIEVYLDDRGWTLSVLGAGTTGPAGTVTFVAEGVTSLESCWGTVLNYWIVALDPADSARSAEKDMNTQLYNAIDNGTLATDVSEFPLVLE